jgi:4-hydroxybenzoate polyprenyltransferase
VLTAYLAERVKLQVVLPLAGALALAARGAAWPELSAFGAAAALAAALLIQFRMWDDLADRDRDALTHPRRALVRATSVAPVVAACVAIAAASIAWVAIYGGMRSAAALVGVNLALAVWYTRRGARTAAGDHLLLAKYPAFVLIVAGDSAANRPARVLLAMAAVYFGACVYEAWHDPASPAARHRRLVASEAVLLVVAIAALSFGARS